MFLKINFEKILGSHFPNFGHPILNNNNNGNINNVKLGFAYGRTNQSDENIVKSTT